MKFIKVETSQGSLGKNIGCEKAPNLLIPGASAVDIVENNLEETNKNIEKFVPPGVLSDTKDSTSTKNGTSEGNFFVGGDHNITYALFRNFAKKYEEPALLIFDAHADCVNDFHPPSHEDFNKSLIQEGTLKSNNLMIVGLRKVDTIEQRYLDEKRVKHIYFKDIKENLVEQIKEFAKGKALYVSIDIDVLRPEEAPGTGYLVEEGMSLDYLLKILEEIKLLAKRVDLVEINPDKDKDNRTIKAGRKIIDIFS